MSDERKNKSQLIEELTELRRQVAVFENAEAGRRQKEGTLLAREAFLNDVFANSEFGVFVVDVLGDREYRYTGINPTFERLVGIQSQEIVGKTTGELEARFGVDAVDYVIRHFDKCVMARETLETESFVKVEGKGDWWLTRLSPLVDADGNVTRLVGSRIIITKRKQAEEARRRIEENLRTTLNPIGEAVIAADIDGAVTRMNPVAETLTGWTLREAEGRPLTEVFQVVDARTREPVVNPVDKVLADGKIVGLTNHSLLISKDHIEFQIADSAAPIR